MGIPGLMSRGMDDWSFHIPVFPLFLRQVTSTALFMNTPLSKTAFLLFFCQLILLSGYSQHPLLLRQPAISPDGSLVAFSFQGDIWTVPATGGRASRITIHDAYESHPVFS